MREEEILFREWEKMGKERVLGYEWLKRAGFGDDERLYVRAKLALANMESMGWIESVGREKGRRGRPGQYWVVTEKGLKRWEEKKGAGAQTRLRDRLEGGKAIRIRMPCDREVWGELVRLAKAGKIEVIVRLTEVGSRGSQGTQNLG